MVRPLVTKKIWATTRKDATQARGPVIVIAAANDLPCNLGQRLQLFYNAFWRFIPVWDLLPALRIFLFPLLPESSTPLRMKAALSRYF